MYRDTLNDQLDYLKHSFLLGLVSLYEIFDQDKTDALYKYVIKTSVDHKWILDLIVHAQDTFLDSADQRIRQYMSFLVRSFVIQLYEVCKTSECFNDIKQQDWFVFLANLRHAYAHGVEWYRRITYYGRKHVTYTRQSDLKIFELKPQWDRTRIEYDQYGGLNTLWDLSYYVQEFTRTVNV